VYILPLLVDWDHVFEFNSGLGRISPMLWMEEASSETSVHLPTSRRHIL